jgi:hypothetical protein
VGKTNVREAILTTNGFKAIQRSIAFLSRQLCVVVKFMPAGETTLGDGRRTRLRADLFVAFESTYVSEDIAARLKPDEGFQPAA